MVVLFQIKKEMFLLKSSLYVLSLDFRLNSYDSRNQAIQLTANFEKITKKMTLAPL